MKSPKDYLTITVLGSGTCVPSLKRSSCSILVETQDLKLLFDSGAGTMRRLLESGTTIFEISHIFYSHFHPDHTAELVPILFASKHSTLGERKTPLTIIAGKGFAAFFKGLIDVYGHWIELAPGLLKSIELDNSSFDTHEFEEFAISCAPMRHNPESLSFKITTSNGKSLVYSGDTDYNDNLISLAKDAHILICESSFPDKMKKAGHLTPSLAGTIATKAGVKKLMLTHFYPECDTVDIEKECRKTYKGPLLLAEDLIKIVLD